LIGLRVALLDQSASDAMRCPDILLLDRLDCHKAHVRSAHRFADRLGIVGVVLVAFHIRFDELWRDELDSISLRLQLPCPMVCTTATFHPDLTARLDVFKHRLQPAFSRQPFRHTGLS
jgi:hypothetical protein